MRFGVASGRRTRERYHFYSFEVLHGEVVLIRLSLVAVLGLLIAVASLTIAHGL